MADARTFVVISRGPLGHDVARSLGARDPSRRLVVVSTAADDPHAALRLDPASASASHELSALIAGCSPDAVALLALSESPATPAEPWRHDAAVVDAVTSALGRCVAAGVSPPTLLLLSSTAVYGMSPASPVVFDERTVPPRDESPASPPARWAEGHRRAEREVVRWAVSAGAGVGVVRAASVLGGPVDSPLAGLLAASLPVRVLGYDPPCQALHYDDLVAGLVLALEQRCGEVVNLVGAEVVPLSRLLAMAGVFAPPLPGPAADLLAPTATGGEALRWRTLADGRRAGDLLGFRPQKTLEDCLRARR